MTQKKTTTFIMDGVKVSSEGRALTESVKIAQNRSKGSDDYTSRVSSNKSAAVPPPPTKVR